ncbi:phosphoribosyl-ATP diphosphatase [Alphaproteobacteria bacterium]|nr:phosphoribosyl-ATP diphosphatase [Alphaproteobacteria bacterium]
MKDPFLDLFSIIEDRKNSKSKKSYTSGLFKEGEKKIAQKFGEESVELIIDYLKGTKKRTIEEATDLIYHLFVLLSSKKINYQDIQQELIKRNNVRRK